MTIATSGPITMASLNAEMGTASGAVLSMSNNVLSLMRDTSAGPFSMSQFRGVINLKITAASNGAGTHVGFRSRSFVAAYGSMDFRKNISMSADVEVVEIQWPTVSTTGQTVDVRIWRNTSCSVGYINSIAIGTGVNNFVKFSIGDASSFIFFGYAGSPIDTTYWAWTFRALSASPGASVFAFLKLG